MGSTTIIPGQPVLGILGGGQLARMTAYAAFRLGLRVHIMEQFAGSPAGQIAHTEVVGNFADHEALRAFAAECDVVTLESEFINEEYLAVIEQARGKLFPSSASVGSIQDKFVQKQTMLSAGIPVTPFRAVETYKEVTAFGTEYGYPFVLKSRRGGYDGYGNATIKSEADIEAGWGKITSGELRNELYCEAFVPFTKELAVMVARGRSGEVAVYPVVETIQQNHICHIVKAPAEIQESSRVAAIDYATRAIQAIAGVGIFGIELFVTEAGEVLVNEIAPRPHNSGHYTIEGCVTSQFEQHIRAVMDWPLGATALRAPGVAMVNVLGNVDGSGALANYPAALHHPAAHVHIYGKSTSRKGRKMGHVTALANTVADATAIASDIAAAITFGG